MDAVTLAVRAEAVGRAWSPSATAGPRGSASTGRSHRWRPDACYRALSVAPDDTGLHLALVELYDERGWAALAAEKLDLVEALADLDGDADAVGRVAAARSGRA